MDFTGQLKIDRLTYRRMVVAATPRGRLWFNRGLGVLLLIVAALHALDMYSTSTQGRPIGVGTVLLFFVQLLLGVFVLFAIELAAARGWRKFAAIGGLKWLYEVGDEGIGIVTAHNDTKIGWDAMAEVDTLPDLWLIKLETGAKLAIPRAAFTKIDAARVDALLEQHHPTTAT